MKSTDYLSVKELAQILKISRIAVFKKIKKNQIKAFKIGRNYAIPTDNLAGLGQEALTPEQKKQISQSVKKTVAEYGQALKLLGKE